MNIGPSNPLATLPLSIARSSINSELANSASPTGASGEAPQNELSPPSNRVTRTAAPSNDRDPSRAENDANEPLTNGLTDIERQEVRELAARDREVRAHEQAHASVGGRYAGSPSYTYQRGPDGRQYAVGGEVSIDTSPIPGDPEATIDKAQIVRRAALAPAQPSSQDRRVAAEASAVEQQARAELLAQNNETTATLESDPEKRGTNTPSIDLIA